MFRRPVPRVVVLSALLASCAAPPMVVDGRSGIEVEVRQVADDLADKDVVFVGEVHDSDAGHRVQAELIELLHARRPDLAVSMEMFERDVQPHLDAYLRGEIEEEAFLESARPWKTYRRHYRPIVEFAKKNGLHVLAANAPTEIARKVAKEGPEALESREHLARESSAPRDHYYERFRAAMGAEDEEDGKGDEDVDDWVYRFYQAQCLKDDTMAETIVDYLERAHRDGKRPLVVHLCGHFHSDFGEGTAARVRQRGPTLQVGSVTMRGVPDVVASAVETGDERAADYIVAVASKPSKPLTGEPHGPVHGPHGKAEDGGEKTEEHGAAEVDEVDPVARPALGFMPDYQVEGGAKVAMLRPDGPADRAGIRQGDLIVELDGLPIADVEEYTEVLQAMKIGDTVEVGVLRGEERLQLKVVVGSR